MADKVDIKFQADIEFKQAKKKIEEFKQDVASLNKIKTDDPITKQRIKDIKEEKRAYDGKARSIATATTWEKKLAAAKEITAKKQELQNQLQLKEDALTKAKNKIADRSATLEQFKQIENQKGKGQLTSKEQRDQKEAAQQLENAKIAAEGLTRDIANLNSEIAKTSMAEESAYNKLEQIKSATVEYADLLEKPAREARELQAAMTASGNEGFAETETVNNIKEASSAMGTLVDKTKEYNTTATEVDTGKLNEQSKKVTETLATRVGKLKLDLDTSTAQMSIAEVTRYLINLKNAQKMIEKEGIPKEWEDFYNKLIPKIDETKIRLNELKAEFKQTNEEPEKRDFTKQYIQLAQKVLPLVQSALQGVSNAIKSVSNALLNLGKKLLSTFKSVQSTISNGITKALGRLKKSIDKAFSTKTLKHNLQTLIKYTFGVRSLFFLFKKLRSAVVDGMKNLVQFESATNLTNTAITEIRTSLLYLKNAWAAAFAPIINYVYPWLVQLLDMLAEVGNAIARFTAYLTGQDTVLQAVRTDAGDYADSLKDAGSSAGGASKKTKELTDRLAAFDDLNVLGVDKDPNGTGSGGGSGKAKKFTPDIDDMFKRIDTPVNEWVDMLKKAWEHADFTDIGRIISEKFESALDTAHEWLVGKGRNIIYRIAQSIGTLLDGFLSNEDLGTKIGLVLNDAITNALLFVNTLITPERVGMIGSQIAKALSEASNVIPEIGKTIGNLLSSAISGFYSFVTDFNFEEFGKNVGKAIRFFFESMSKEDENGMSGWERLGKSLSEGANGLITALNNAIEQLPAEEIGKALGEFIGSLEIDEKQLEKLAENIWDGLVKAWNGLDKENSDFTTGLEKLLNKIGIVAGVIALLATALTIISTILGTIAGALPTIMSLATLIGGTGGIAAGFSTMATALTVIGSGIGWIILGIGAAIISVVGIWDAIKNWIDDLIHINDEWENFERIVNDALDILANFGDPEKMLESGKSLIEGLIKGMEDKIAEHEGWLGVVQTIIFGPFLENLKLLFGIHSPSTVMDEQGGYVMEGFVNGLTKWLPDIKSLWTDVKSFVTNTTTQMKESVLTIWGSLKEGIKAPINGIIGIINGMISGIIGGINAMIRALNSLTRDIQLPDWLQYIPNMSNLAGARIGFNISQISVPQIPKLAQGAVIPPNKEFMAVLGDQSRGTNIEAPLDTIKQAVAEELAGQIAVLQEGFSDVVRAINNKELAIGDKEIGKANQRYTSQQRLIRGTAI